MSSNVVYDEKKKNSVGLHKFQNSLIFLIFLLIANVSTSVTSSRTEVVSKKSLFSKQQVQPKCNCMSFLRENESKQRKCFVGNLKHRHLLYLKQTCNLFST